MRIIIKYFIFLFVIISLYSCSDSDNSCLKLILNGNNTDKTIEYKDTENGLLFDIKGLMSSIQGRFTPVYKNQGVVVQYGKRIGFAGKGFEYGMVQVQLCEMVPPVQEYEDKLWAPQGFIEAVVNGSISVNEKDKSLEITSSSPLQIGDIIPEAQALSKALEDRDYTVLQGDISLSNAIDVCYAGYSPNANGNNAQVPYFCIQAPAAPSQEYVIAPPPFVFTLRQDEGLILIGRTPPQCDYFSYRSYFLNRCTNASNPFERQKIYTQLGDPINAYNIDQDLFYPFNVAGITNPFKSFFILVSTADKSLYEDVVEAAAEAGLDQDKILLDIIDHDLVQLGNDDFADTINFLHRFSNPGSEQDGEDYKANPTLEILRLTPNKARQADFLTPFTARERGSGNTEDYLQDAVDQLGQAIVSKYEAEYNIKELETEIWMAKSGAQAIDALEDVLGETRDTLYLKTGNFTFNEDSIVIAYGVNHSLIPKAIYSNISCYGAEKINGFGGITNKDYNGTVSDIFSVSQDIPYKEKLYVYKFARKNIDEYTFNVPQDINGTLKGINFGDNAFIGFRSYIDPDSEDLIGPDSEEIIFDKVLLLAPK